jgi:heme-degrading monooxygenase HmoA
LKSATALMLGTLDLKKVTVVIWEIAQIEVKPGSEAAFEDGVNKAAPLFKRARGCKSMELQRSHEFPQRYRLVVGWDTIDDHMVHFRNSEDFQGWRNLVGPHFASPPQVEHVSQALKAF